jgi:Tfp pilus assembly protein PilF
MILASLFCLAQALPGTYSLVQDSDGTKPKSGAVIKLTLTADGSVSLSAVQPGQTFQDSGTYSATGDRMTLHFEQMDKGCTNQKYSLQGSVLTLPFKMLSDGPGASTWKSEWAGQSADGNAGEQQGSIFEVVRQTLQEASQQDNAVQRRQMDAMAAQDTSQYSDGIAGAYYGQSIAYFLRGYLYEAWYGFAKACSLHPQNAVYLNNLATVLLKLDKPDTAVAILKWIADTFPVLDTPYGNLGIAYVKAGECEKGRKALERAMQLDPENGMYEYAYGKALSCLGRADEAKRYYAIAWSHGYGGGGTGEDGGDETTGPGEGDTGTGNGSGTGTSGTGTSGSSSGRSGKSGQGASGHPTPSGHRSTNSHNQNERNGIPPEWVGHWEAKYVRARSGENNREANTQFGKGITGTNINLQTLACAKEFSMEISSDGSIHGRGKILYVYQGKAINPAMMLMPLFSVASNGGFACNLKNGYQLRDWDFSGKVDKDGNVEIRGLPTQQLDLLNVGKWQKITPWSPMPPDGPGKAMLGPFHMRLTEEENSQPVIHVDQWLDLGDKLIRRVHYQAHILKTDTPITPDCKYVAPKKEKCPHHQYMKTKIKYAPKNGVTVEVSKDLGSGDVSTKVGASSSVGSNGSVEAGVDSKGNMSLDGSYGMATGSVKYNMEDGSYQVSAGVGIDSSKLTPGFPGKIKEKLELTYDSKCGWGIKGTMSGQVGSASASVEGCVFLTQGP